MTATFRVTFGEFKCVNGGSRKTIDTNCLAEFWNKIGAGNRRGVYVFGVRAAKGWKPLYVGQAKKQTFKARIGQHVKTDGDFNRMLKRVKKGTPVLFLIGRTGKGRKSNSAIDELEIEFINYAFARNKNLHNDRGIKKPKYVIEGFGSRGKPAMPVANLKTIIGYD
jgi:hypothetical protein